MTSKTPRTIVGDFMNASNTQPPKHSRTQSMLDDTPRSPSWIPTSSRKGYKSPASRTLRSGMDGPSNTPLRTPIFPQRTPMSKSGDRPLNSPGRVAKSPKQPLMSPGRVPRSVDRVLNSPGRVLKSPGRMLTTADRAMNSLVQLPKSPGRSVQHDRVSSLRSKRRSFSSVIAEEITPRSMVAAFLEGADSTMPIIRPRARTSQSGVVLSVPAKLGPSAQGDKRGSISQRSRRLSNDADCETPRTLIENFLQNASDAIETPLVNIHRIKANDYISPDVRLPSSVSYHTPSPFKTTSSDKSTDRVVSSLRRKTPRKFIKPSASNTSKVASPFLSSDVSLPSSMSYHTPSPFKSPVSPSTNDKRSMMSRKAPRGLSKTGKFMLDIPEDMMRLKKAGNNPKPDESSANIFEESDGDYDEIEDPTAIDGYGNSKYEKEFSNPENKNEYGNKYRNAENQDGYGNEYANPEHPGEYGNEYANPENQDKYGDEYAYTENQDEYGNEFVENLEEEQDYGKSRNSRRTSYHSHGNITDNADRQEYTVRTTDNDIEYDDAGDQDKESDHVEYENAENQTEYGHTGNRSESQHSGNHSRHENTGNRSKHEYSGNRSKYEHMGNQSKHELTGNQNGYEHTGIQNDENDYEKRQNYESDIENEEDGNGELENAGGESDQEYVQNSNENSSTEGLHSNESGRNRNQYRYPENIVEDSMDSTAAQASDSGDGEDDDNDEDHVEDDNNVQDDDFQGDVQDTVGDGHRQFDGSGHRSSLEVSTTRGMEADDVDEDGEDGIENNPVSPEIPFENANVRSSLRHSNRLSKSVSGLNQSSAVPGSFAPAFTSTQQPSKDWHEPEQAQEDMEYEDMAELVIVEKKKVVRKPRQKSKYSLPVTLVKKQFTHFSSMRVSKEAIEEVMKASEVYWDNLASDLQAYAKHAGRKTITMADFHLLFKRQGLVNDKVSLYSLIEKYLPMEERRKLIPVARAGNRIELLK